MYIDLTALQQLLTDLDSACTSVNNAKQCIDSGDSMSSIKSNTSIDNASYLINSVKTEISGVINRVDEAQKNMLSVLMGLNDEMHESINLSDLGFDSNIISAAFSAEFDMESLPYALIRTGIYSEDEQLRKKIAPLIEKNWDEYTNHYGYDLIVNNEIYMDYIANYGSKGLAYNYLDYVKECKEAGNSKFNQETVVINKEKNKEVCECIEDNFDTTNYEIDKDGNLIIKLSDYVELVNTFNENVPSFGENAEELYVYVPDLADGKSNTGIYLSDEVNSDGSPVYKYVKLNENSEWIEMSKEEINNYIEYAGLDFRNESYIQDYFEDNKDIREFHQFYLKNYDNTMKNYIDYGNLFAEESDIIYKMENRVIPSIDYRYIYDTDEYKDIANLSSKELDDRLQAVSNETAERSTIRNSKNKNDVYEMVIYLYDDMFKVASDEEKALYIYLYENGYQNSETGEIKTGKDALESYMNDNEDLINDEIGFYKAEDLLNTIQKADAWNEEIWASIRTVFEGNVDGTKLYGQGVYNAITLGNDGKMSKTDYKNLYYIQAFASRTKEEIEAAFNNGQISEKEKNLYYEMQDVTGFKNTWYKNLYSASLSNGRNLIPMALNKLLPGLGTASSVVSMGGNGTNQYLREGYTLEQSALRGTADALIEVGDDLLGPGSNPLGKSNKLDLASIFSIDMTDASRFKSGMMNILNHGLNFGSNVIGNIYEEGIKEPLLGVGADYFILGKTDTLNETLKQATTKEYWIDQLFSSVFMDAETTMARGLTAGIPTIDTTNANTNNTNNNPFNGLQTTNIVDESTLKNLSDSFQIVQDIDNVSRNETAYNEVTTGLETMTDALKKGAISANYFINNCIQTMGEYINTVFTSKISDAISRVDSLRNNEEIRTKTTDTQGYDECMDELSRLIASDVVKNNASHVSQIVTAMEKIVTTTKSSSEELVVNLQRLMQEAKTKVESAVVNYNDNNDRIEPFRELFGSDVTTEMNAEQRTKYEEQIRNAMQLAYIDVFDTGGVNLSELYDNILSILQGEGSIDEKLDGLESYNNDRNSNVTTATLISGTIKQIIESSMKTVNETINSDDGGNIRTLDSLKDILIDEHYEYMGHGIGRMNDTVIPLILKQGLRTKGNSLYYTTDHLEQDLSMLQEQLDHWGHLDSDKIVLIRLPVEYINQLGERDDANGSRYMAFYNEEIQDNGDIKYYLNPKFIVGVYDRNTQTVIMNEKFEENLSQETIENLKERYEIAVREREQYFERKSKLSISELFHGTSESAPQEILPQSSEPEIVDGDFDDWSKSDISVNGNNITTKTSAEEDFEWDVWGGDVEITDSSLSNFDFSVLDDSETEFDSDYLDERLNEIARKMSSTANGINITESNIISTADKTRVIVDYSKSDFMDFLQNDSEGEILKYFDDEGVEILRNSKKVQERIRYILDHSKYKNEIFKNDKFVDLFLEINEIYYGNYSLNNLNFDTHDLILKKCIDKGFDSKSFVRLFNMFSIDYQTNSLNNWAYSEELLYDIFKCYNPDTAKIIIDKYRINLLSHDINLEEVFDMARHSVCHAYGQKNMYGVEVESLTIPVDMITTEMAKKLWQEYDIYTLREIIHDAHFCTDPTLINEYVKKKEQQIIDYVKQNGIIGDFQEIIETFVSLKEIDLDEDIDFDEFVKREELISELRNRIIEKLYVLGDIKLEDLEKMYTEEGMNKVKEFIQQLSDNAVSNYIIDYHFEENFHNIMLDVSELLNLYYAGNITLSPEKIELYQKIANIDYLTMEEKIELHEKLKQLNMIEQFYDDMSYARTLVRQAIKDYSMTYETLKQYKNDELSEKYGVDVFTIGKNPFFAIIKSGNNRGDEYALPTGHSFSLIGHGAIGMFAYPSENKTFLYDSSDLNPEQIVHIYPSDSTTSYHPFIGTTKGTDCVNMLMMPDELTASTGSGVGYYNEILILEEGSGSNYFQNRTPHLKKMALYCIDTITDEAVEVAKKNGVGIFLLDSSNYHVPEEMPSDIYRHKQYDSWYQRKSGGRYFSESNRKELEENRP